jgi:amidase
MSDHRSSDETPGSTPAHQNEGENKSEHGRDPERDAEGLSRRGFLRWGAAAGAVGAAAGAGVPLAGLLAGSATPALAQDEPFPGGEIEEATIAQLQARMAAGTLTSAQLVQLYLNRIVAIDQSGPTLRSVIQVNPDALAIAARLDQERAASGPRGPLHGIPILLKDNIDTGDALQTTAGSLALVGAPAPRDARVVARLRRAGAVILGKANLSEWANFRGFSSSSGWSGRGGQTRNPYVLDRNPCGSSSGSAVAVAASLTAVALGTETDGSIVCPASANGIVGIKPTVGLVTRSGVIPISHTQDTVGPYGRTVADAATVLGALTGGDPRDPATFRSRGRNFRDYRQFLDANGLDGARIGVTRGGGFTGYSSETDAIFEEALEAMATAGAVLVDPAEIPTADELLADPAELIVLIWEFKRDLNAYLATRTGVPVSTLADVIELNREHAAQELPYFGQELMELAEIEAFTEAEYRAALERGRRLAGPEGIDAALAADDLDALVAPTGSPAWTIDLINGDHFLGASSGPAAVAGYPIVNVPAGFAFGLPVGISFMGTAWSEPTLIKLASGFEAAHRVRQAPQYLPSVPDFAPVPAGLSPARIARLRQKLETAPPSLRQRLRLV